MTTSNYEIEIEKLCEDWGLYEKLIQSKGQKPVMHHFKSNP